MANGNGAVDLSQNINHGASASVNGVTGNSMSGQGIDYNHPLFLSPTDVSGISIISFQLLGIENYTLWSRSTKLALLGRNKIGLIDGTCQKEVYGEELWGQWERVNAIVLSWLMNSVSKSLLSGIAFASSALNVWNDLKERFDRVDGSRTYSLHKEIVALQQGTASVSMYYTRLKNFWDEFEAVVPAPCCNCEKSKGFVTHMNRQKLYQFLMGLNESYHQARSQILMMDPLPTVNHAYAMIVGDESQKAVVTNTGGIGLNSVGLESLAMYSRTGNSSVVSQRFKKNSLLVCDFCKCKGHVKEFCYKIIGYSPDFKSKRRVQGANSVYATPEFTAQKQSDPTQANFSYGLNTNVSIQDNTKVASERVDKPITHAERDVKQLLQGCSFTKDQYDQILKMLDKRTEASTSECNAANAAGALQWEGEGSW